MPTNETVCHCSAKLRLEDWAGHQRQYHAPLSGFACGDCAFVGSVLSSAIGHSFLDGHSLNDLEVLRQTLQGTSVPVSAAVELQSVTLPGTEDKQPDNSVLVTEERSKLETEYSVLEAVTTSIDYTQDVLCDTTSEDTLSRELKCAKCDKIVKAGGNFPKVTRHVRSCLGIRPLACSACRHRSSEAYNIRQHIQRKCPGAKVVRVESERCQEYVREGLRKCFPGLEVKEAVWSKWLKSS